MAYTPNADYLLEVAKGNVSGHASVNKFGANTSSAVGIEEEVWDGSAVYVYPATALMTDISQKVDQVAMRGATIEIQGLDASWNAVTQTAILDGTNTTTQVVLTTPLIRCFRMKVLANVVSDQDISIHNVGNTQDYAIISAGKNQTLMAIYTVPNGKTAYIIHWYADVLEDVVAGKDPDATNFMLCVADRDNGYEFQVKHERGIPKGEGAMSRTPFMPYLKVTQKSDIAVKANCTGRAGHLHAGFDIILVNN